MLVTNELLWLDVNSYVFILQFDKKKIYGDAWKEVYTKKYRFYKVPYYLTVLR